jgi:hypothetical protein
VQQVAPPWEAPAQQAVAVPAQVQVQAPATDTFNPDMRLMDLIHGKTESQFIQVAFTDGELRGKAPEVWQNLINGVQPTIQRLIAEGKILKQGEGDQAVYMAM